MALASFDRIRKRHLAIYVLARFQGGHGDVFVLMRTGGDDDGLNVLVGEDGPVILNLRGARRFGGTAAHHGRVAVADGGEFGVGVPPAGSGPPGQEFRDPRRPNR